MTPNQTQGIRHQKYSTYVRQDPRVPNFHQFRSMTSRFQDTADFMIFPLTPMLKVPQNIKIFGRSPNYA